MKILSHASAKENTKRLKGFTFRTDYYWSFSNDIMAVKVLTWLTPLLVLMQKSFWW